MFTPCSSLHTLQRARQPPSPVTIAILRCAALHLHPYTHAGLQTQVMIGRVLLQDQADLRDKICLLLGQGHN